MKKLLQIPSLVLLAVFWSMIVCHAACTGSSPTWTASADLTSVQSCVTQSSRGDTVNVSSGTEIWSSPLTITKAIKLKGAGRDTGGTKVYFAYGYADTTEKCGDCALNFGGAGNWGAIIYRPSDPQSDENEEFSVSGFDFNQSPSVTRVGGIKITNCSVDYPLRKIKIYNNNFTYREDSEASQHPLVFNFTGYIYGVIYNNLISGRHPYHYIGNGNHLDETVEATRVFDANWGSYCKWYGGEHSWENQVWIPGDSGNSMVLEDNIWHYHDPSGIVFGASAMGGNGFVLRYNTLYIYDSDRGYQNGWEGHSAYYYTYSSVGQEVYGNYQIGTSTSSLYRQSITFCRGGQCLGWGNLYSASGTQMSPFVEIAAECDESQMRVGTTHVCGSDTRYPGAYVCDSAGNPQHPNKSYFFRNFYGIAGATLATAYTTTYGDGEPAGTGCKDKDWTYAPVRNTEFWGHDPTHCNASGCTRGIGCGTTKPATCTTGTGFWVTTDSGACTSLTTDKVGAGGNYSTKKQNGALWRCVSTNNWGTSAYYTPYAYPHPYREAGADSEQVLVETPSPSTQQACTTNPRNTTISVQATDNVDVTGCKACADGETCVLGSLDYSSENMNITMANSEGNTWSATVSNACDASFKYNVICNDATDNGSNQVQIAYDVADNNDTTPPTLDSYVLDANGRVLTLTFSEAIKDGGEYSDDDWTFTVDGDASGITCDSGWNTNTLTCTTDSCVPTGVTVTLKYTQPGNGIEDYVGNALATTGTLTVTNNSTQSCGAVTSLWYPDVPTYSTSTDQPSNLGFQFTSSVTGTITHVCYYKDATLTGTHYGSVWCASSLCGTIGTELSREEFTSDTGTGWKCQELSTPVSILENVPYRVSVHFPSSAYIRTSSYFSNAYTEQNLTVPSFGAYFRDSSSISYPNQANTGTNFWIDMIITYATESGPWTVTISNGSAAGAKCTIGTSRVVDDGNATEVEVTVANGWKALFSGCGSGSTVQSGNEYTYTTAAITEDCTVEVTCVERVSPPWLVP